MKALLPILLCAAGLASRTAAADGFIWINVSIKCVVNPFSGTTPSTMSDAVLREAFENMNSWLANNYRGYRVRAVDLDANQNFKRVGAVDDYTGPSKWYSTDLKPETGQGELDNIAFENAAKANKPLYGWRDDAINIYFNNGGYSRANFASSGRSLIISAYGLLQDDKPAGAAFTQSYKVAGNLLHEIGHYYELYHTFGGSDDDGIADTAKDPNNFCCGARNELNIRNNIAQHNFSKNFSALTIEQQVLVDNTANNAMAYIQLFYDDPAQNKVLTEAERFGPTRFLFTELQMDKWTDYANNQRLVSVSGKTWFVDASAGVSGSGTSASPVKTLATGINAASASGTDIVLLRPGTYTASVLNKPVTIRATRNGGVVIQKP